MKVPLESCPCPICGEKRHREWKPLKVIRRRRMLERLDYEGDEFNFVICETCGHRYMNPMPTEAFLAEYYGGDYFSEDDQAGHNQNLELTIMDRFYFSTCRSLPVATSGQKLLEIGPGTGSFMVWAKEKGYEVMGYDLASVEMHPSIHPEEMTIGPLSECDFPEETFDVIVSHWVFEHMRSTIEVMENIKKWLKPGGKVVISVPNSKCLDASLFGDYWHHAVVPDHLSQFSMKSVEKMMVQQDLEVTHRQHDVLSFDFSMSLGGWISEKTQAKNPMQGLLIRLLSLPFGPLKSLLRQSGNITVTAQKKS